MNSLTSEPKTSLPLLTRFKRFKRRVKASFDTTTLNILDTFPLFLPCCSATYKEQASITIQTINQIFPFLSTLSQSVHGELLAVEDIAHFPKTDEEKASVLKLKERLDFYGSDKANKHNYHNLYGAILSNKDNIQNILEIGLGTNNTDVVSNMGTSGKPGASIRSFRDYCPNANVYGADIDKRILFEEDRIKTYFVDQTDPATFSNLLSKLPETLFDLVIDDGLHSPHANVESLRFGLGIVNKGGWVVVEDIRPEATCLWQVVAALLPSEKYRSYIFNATGAIVFAVQRLN